jgi:UDP-glucose 4-epimerase
MLPLPLPAVTATGQAARAVGATDFSPEQIRLLTHGRVVDTARMRQVLGFAPQYTTAETLADYAAARGRGPLGRSWGIGWSDVRGWIRG